MYTCVKRRRREEKVCRYMFVRSAASRDQQNRGWNPYHDARVFGCCMRSTTRFSALSLRLYLSLELETSEKESLWERIDIISKQHQRIIPTKMVVWQSFDTHRFLPFLFFFFFFSFLSSPLSLLFFFTIVDRVHHNQIETLGNPNSIQSQSHSNPTPTTQVSRSET